MGKLRFAKINPREKSTGSQFAKLNPSEMLKKITRENKSTRKFLFFWCRSSRPQVLCKKVILRNFAKLTGKNLNQSLRPATLLKKKLWHRCFPVNFAKFLRTPFLTEHLRWLLLKVAILNREESKMKRKTKSNSLRSLKGKKQFHVLYVK